MKTVDVVIPVHNSAHWLAWCLEELFRFKSASLRTVLVVNDHSEPDQTDKINEIAARYPQIVFIENENSESGFGYACGLGAEKCSADVILFLNTDCLVTDGLIDRLGNVFETDSKVALACPLSNNSSNITYPMIPGFSYRDMAQLLSEVTNNSENEFVVEACTIVGNCLMVSRDFFEKAGGFSSEWGIGYGEETDLHMKALSENLKGVVHTGCYVYHYGGGTFNYELEIEAHREKNYQLFMSKWAEEYNKLALRCENSSPVKIVDKNLKNYWNRKDKSVELDALFYLLGWAKDYIQWKSRNDSLNPISIINEKLEEYWQKENQTIKLDVLFYLPGIDQGVGGVNAVIAICNDLIRKGMKAGVALIGASDFQIEQYKETVLFNFLHFESNEAFLENTTVLPKVIFSTIIWSGPIVAKFAAARNAIAAQFVQGYEAFFWNGTRHIESVESYQSTDYVVTTSNWLRGMVQRHVSPDQHIKQLPLVVNTEIFFSANLPRSIDVILVLRSSTDKGQWILVELLDRLVSAGKKVAIFCATDYLILKSKYGKQVQFINLPVEQYLLAQIMRRAKLFIDASLHEGYGLLPLEAALCGCSLLLSDSGGIRDFVDYYDSEIIPNLLDLDNIMNSVDRILAKFDEQTRNTLPTEKVYDSTEWQKYLREITEGKPSPFFQPELIKFSINPPAQIPVGAEEVKIKIINPPEASVEIPVLQFSTEADYTIPLSTQISSSTELSEITVATENEVDAENHLVQSENKDGFLVKTYRSIVPQRMRLAIRILLSGRV